MRHTFVLVRCGYRLTPCRLSAVEVYGSLSPSKTVCKRNETRAILNAEWPLCYASRKFIASMK